MGQDGIQSDWGGGEPKRFHQGLALPVILLEPVWSEKKCWPPRADRQASQTLWGAPLVTCLGLACGCHLHQRAGPQRQEAGGQAQGGVWLGGWLPGHVTRALTGGPGLRRGPLTRAQYSVVTSETSE